MGGKSQTTRQTSTNTAAPPSWAQPQLQDIVSQAQSLYGANPGNAQIQQGLNMATQTAQGGNPLGQSSYTNASNLQQMGGLLDNQRQVLTNLGNEYGMLGAPSSAQTNLAGYASGANLTGNPYLDRILETTNEGIANRTNGMFGAAGRSFSPAHAAAVARNIAQADNQARFADYNQQVQNQFNANQLIDSQANTRAGLRTGILGQQFGGEQQGIGNMLGIANNAGTIDNARYLDANSLNRIGQQAQQQPWQNLSNYQNVVRGASQGYGTQNGEQTNTTPGPSGLQQAIGAGMAVAGLATGNPMMALQGASSLSGGGGGKGGGGGGGKGGQTGPTFANPTSGMMGGVPFPIF